MLDERLKAKGGDYKEPWELLLSEALRWEKAGEKDHALTYFAAAKELGDPEGHVSYHLGKHFLEAGLLEDAQRELAAALEFNPGHALTLFELARIHIGLREYGRAETLLRDVLKEEHDHDGAWELLFRIFMVHRRYEEGLSIYHDRETVSGVVRNQVLYGVAMHRLGIQTEFERTKKALGKADKDQLEELVAEDPGERLFELVVDWAA